jgi:hypothetical protein
MPFDDLVEDVVLRILARGEIFSVVSLGQASPMFSKRVLADPCQTSKYYHQLALQKNVWFSLLVDVKSRGFLDHISVSELRDLSSVDLITLAKTSQNGPTTWSPPPGRLTAEPPTTGLRKSLRRLAGKSSEPFPIPEVVKRLILHPTTAYLLSAVNRAALLRGGKFVLFNNDYQLECWRVEQDALIWTYRSDIPHLTPKVFEFSAEVDEGGETVRIVIGQNVQLLSLSYKK